MKTDTRVLVDFSLPGEAGRWRNIDDGVMGGLSQSVMKITADNTGIFQGHLSLENNGGFASIRRAPEDYRLADFKGVDIRVKGDGRTYQLRIRTDDRFDGVSYGAQFETTAGRWITVKLPFESFRATYHGRRVPGAPDLSARAIRQIGFLIADKREGKFILEIDWIAVYK